MDREEILQLVDEGRLEEARAAYEGALARRKDDVELLADAADFHVRALQGDDPDPEALERGLELARRGAKLARRAGDRPLESDLATIEGSALSQLGESRAAERRLAEAIALDGENVEARIERAFALYELCRLEEARDAVADALARAPDDAWAHHVAGLVAERLGDAAEAKRRFARARRLAPEDYPEPVTLPRAAFDAAVEDAFEALPQAVRDYLVNVPITVEDFPASEDLLATDPPHSPSILGLFRGAPYGQKGSGDPWSHFPSSIVLYQRNLERFARNRAELIEQIEVTLLHEVGHFLGLDEEELAGRGLD